MIWPALRAAIYTGLGVLEVAVDVYDQGKRIVRRLLPPRPEEVMPLTHADAERQAQFGRCAGHESEPRCASLRSPPR